MSTNPLFLPVTFRQDAHLVGLGQIIWRYLSREEGESHIADSRSLGIPLAKSPDSWFGCFSVSFSSNDFLNQEFL